MTEVTVTIQTLTYKFLIDGENEFNKLVSVAEKNSIIEATDSDAEKMKNYWDTSFGKVYKDNFTEKQQAELFKNMPALKP